MDSVLQFIKRFLQTLVDFFDSLIYSTETKPTDKIQYHEHKMVETVRRRNLQQQRQRMT